MRLWRRKPAEESEPTLAVNWVPIGEELGVEDCLVQAAQAIDTAGMLAASRGDAERLLQTGEYWTKLADFIIAYQDHAEKKQENKKKSDFPTGFQTKKDEDARSDSD